MRLQEQNGVCCSMQLIYVQIKPDWVISCQCEFSNRIQMKLYFFLSLPIVNNTMYYCRKKTSTYN